ncbi:TonB-dependent receptor plug domain-containing protein [Desulfobulbus rhabdoformis]|uniref:TonB-dependent receptor domain-containing protein n=1 Tax=Desulfobulbus rhabdoformis TaxID=34032 RepID=UPI001965E5E0|nr:TonB-dependent receptor [Desulfobulbus rhabdoformis]MBM9615532.1 TonB-dependent receptor plug domain-containing protein [Desulfobulbus rhabdoformis]
MDLQYPTTVLASQLATTLILAATSPALANDAAATAPPRQLEAIVIEDNSEQQREDLKADSPTNLYRVEASARFGTEVFTKEDIRALKPNNVFDLLEKAAGVNLIYQGRRSPYIVEERGGGTFTYIIDGAVLPSSANRILYKFPVAAIEEMQVVRGATALTLGPSIPIGASNSGSGLNTGFVIIRTKQPKKTEGVLTVSAEKAAGGHPIESSESLYVGTRFGEADGESPARPLQGYIAGLLANMDRPSQDSWFDGRSNTGGMASAGFTYGKFNLNMMAYKDSGTMEMQRGVSTDGSLMAQKWWYDPLETELYTSDMALQWTPNQTTLFNIFKVEYEQTEHDGTFGSSTATLREFSEETSGFGLRHNARFGNTLLQAGWQMFNSQGFGPNLSSAYNRYDTTINGWSLSVEQKLFNERLVLDAGYRQDQKHIDYSSKSAASDGANNNVDMAPAKIYALGARYQLNDMFTLNGRYYYGDQGTSDDFALRSLGDDLEAERQERIELALEANLVSWFRPTLTYFDIDTENAKTASTSTYEVDGETYYYYTQSDERRRGLELMIKGQLFENTSYSFSWTRMLDAETTSNGITSDAIGLSTPENMFGLTLSHTWQPYRFNLSIKQVDQWTQTSSPKGTYNVDGIGDYTRIDANIQRDFLLGDTLLTATLFGRNLGDEHYSTRYVTGYYPDRGRTVGLELAWAF